MKDQQIKDLTNILHLNYDMPEDYKDFEFNGFFDYFPEVME